MPKQTDPCMFCGGLPCVCDGGQKKKSSSSTRKAVSAKKPAKASPDSVRSVSASDEIDFGAIPSQVKPKFTVKSDSEKDLSYLSALRALRPIVSGPDQRMIDRELSKPYPQDLDRRISAWKEGHGKTKPGSS